MDTSHALAGLSALAQESRLKVFRLLVQRGPEGMAAGDIARNLKLPHNTLSSHLGILSRASLVKSRKESRSIIYSVDLEGTRALLSFLVEGLLSRQTRGLSPADRVGVGRVLLGRKCMKVVSNQQPLERAFPVHG